MSAATLPQVSRESPLAPVSFRVVGTAGHVDHGKSTLIECLTGIHPDRLKEEQARGMTIDLGFGWLTLPNGREVGIVDVPGHRDFIENMLAGIAGIDAALLVVAADEGVMPQTREHLAIIDLLRIPCGVIALTKADLASDDKRLDALEDDLRSEVRGTVLQDSPIVRVSARTGIGIPQLVDALQAQLERQPDRPNLRRPRLAIDRVFSMEGFGTVVTGMLADGQLTVGDEVRVLPADLRGRIRGLQNHHRQVSTALPGSRTAVNIAGISAEQLHRGDVLSHTGQYEPTRRIDARFRLLASASKRIQHNGEVKFFSGTNESIASLRLLGTHELDPGNEAWVQLELQRPVVCARGDTFILRRPSPPETLGGGTVADAHPAGRHRRFDEAVLGSLVVSTAGNAADILYEACLALGAAPLRDILNRSQLTLEAANTALQALYRQGQLIPLEPEKTSADPDQLLIARRDWSAIGEKILGIASAFHARFPLRAGMPREELRSQLGLSARVFRGVLGAQLAQARLVEHRDLVALPGHSVRFTAEQEEAVASLLRRFERRPYATPTMKECKLAVGEEILGALKELGYLIQLSEDVIFRKTDYDVMVGGIRNALANRKEITLAEVRDMFQTSRKYAQAMLEHLDAEGVTRREGDSRVSAG